MWICEALVLMECNRGRVYVKRKLKWNELIRERDETFLIPHTKIEKV